MPHINDAINAAIPNIAGSFNAINDKLLRYYQANGATSLDLDDAENQFLVAKGAFNPSQLNDMWFERLRAWGYTGALDDMELAYWGAGGVAPLTLPVIYSTSIPQLIVGVPYSFQLVGGGSPTITYTVSAGTLPTSIALTAAGLLTGTPTVPDEPFNFTVSATNGQGVDTQAYTGTVGSAPLITLASLPAGTVGVPYSQTVTATGSTPISFAVIGRLPNGLSIGSSSGVISGTPLVPPLTTNFTVRATNPYGFDDQAYSVVIA